MKSKAVILCGIPLTGKSTARKKIEELLDYPKIICRDDLRKSISGSKTYPKWSKELEEKVNKVVIRDTKAVHTLELDVIIDQTNVKTSYLINWIKEYKDTHDVYVCVCHQPFIKILYRNIKRYLFGGERKWIPIKVLRNMRKNFNEIDWYAVMNEGVITFEPQNLNLYVNDLRYRS